MSLLNMYGALLNCINIIDCGDGDLKLEEDGTPMFFWDEEWWPIVGHFFWDNQNGAKTFCKKLGLSGGKLERTKEKYSEKSIIIGNCKKDQDLIDCTPGEKRFWGKGGPAIRIACEGDRSDTALSTCGGTS